MKGFYYICFLGYFSVPSSAQFHLISVEITNDEYSTFMYTKPIVNPNHSKILQGALFLGEKLALLETGTFTSSNGAKLLPGKKYRP